MEEYRRLLYVALTRAASRLYVCGWESGRGEGEGTGESWYGLIRRALQLHDDKSDMGADEPLPDIVLTDHGPPLQEKESAEKKPQHANRRIARLGTHAGAG